MLSFSFFPSCVSNVSTCGNLLPVVALYLRLLQHAALQSNARSGLVAKC
jgi:hypothetical protein